MTELHNKEAFIKPKENYWHDLSSFVVAVREGDLINKYCWQCFKKKGTFALQFRHKTGERGFICFDCGVKSKTEIYANLAFASVEHSDLYKFLITQSNKCKGYQKNEDSRVSAPVLYYPMTLEELRMHIDQVKNRYYPKQYLLSTLIWMMNRKNPKIRVYTYQDRSYFLFTKSPIQTDADMAKFLEEKNSLPGIYQEEVDN